MSTQPNILFLMTDQMQGQLLDPEHPCITPNLDKLIARGVRFTRATTPSATCSPARASLMTGRLPHTHGVLEVNHCVDEDQCCLREQYPHWAQRLGDAGYFTSYVGKWHVDKAEDPGRFGWQVDISQHSKNWAAEVEPDVYDEKHFTLLRRNDQPPGYRDTAQYAVTKVKPEQRNIGDVTRLALAQMEKAHQSQQPWCCFISCHAPHDPFICGEDAYELYDVDALPLPANLGDSLNDRPHGYRKLASQWDAMTDRQRRECMACYYGMVSEVDQMYGRLLDYLDQTGQTSNTVVVFTSDHGELMGAHGLYCKNISAFEEVYRIPLVMAGPGINAGATCDARVQLHEIGPTLLELAGAQPIDTEGESAPFTSILETPDGPDAAARTEAYAEYYGNVFRYTQRVLWQDNWKFAFNGYDIDELYDLSADPGEMNNLAASDANRDRMVAMMKRIWEIAHATGDPMARLTYPGTRVGIVGPRSV